jgi:glycerate 2-kinase
MRKVLLAPNSFKECAYSTEVTDILAESLAGEGIEVVKKPLSDGGDGFLNICDYYFKGKRLKYTVPKVYSNAHNEIEVLLTDNNEVIIESADVVGLKTIPQEARDVKSYNTFPLGILLKNIIKDFSVNTFKIGIGGTGTNDLGLGICAAFGLQLLDDWGDNLENTPKNYLAVRDIIWEQPKNLPKIECITDVTNILTGPTGATWRYGGQKGGSKEDLRLMEEGINNILSILYNKGLADSTKEYSGAGGGLAAGLNILMGARIRRGKDFILEDLGLKESGAFDLVITGEGTFDIQSLDDKAPGVVINKFLGKTPIVVICGAATEEVKLMFGGRVKFIELVKFFHTKEEAIKRFKEGMKMAGKEIRNMLFYSF